MSTNIEVSQAMQAGPSVVGPLLLEIKEDQWFDRKNPTVSPLKLACTEVALANADGGTIAIGLGDKRVQGIRRFPENVNNLRQTAFDHTIPPVPAHYSEAPCINELGQADQILIIEIEPSSVVHTNQKDEAYLRIGDESRRLSFQQRQQLMYDKGQASFEANPVKGASLTDLDPGELDSYARALKHPDPERLLVARNLILPNKGVTAAAILLFGSSPGSHFPEAYVRVLRYRGTERGAGKRQQIVSDERIEGTIPNVLLSAAETIDELQPTRRALGKGGRFEATEIIPRDAWLEGLVNAVVHRSYSLVGDHIRVEIFDDRIEVESPGRFPGLIRPDDPLKATRFARNPRIARVCSDLNFGQELGEGIRRMFEEMRMAGLGDPLYEQTAGSVRLTLLAVAVDRELERLLPSGSRFLISLLRRHGPLGTGNITQLMGLSRPVVLRKLQALRDLEVVEWEGKSPQDPRAVWRLKRGV